MDGSHLVMEGVGEMPGASDGVMVTWEDISLQGSKCVAFSGLFAEAEARSNSNDDIDSSDFLLVEYQLAGSTTWVTLLRFSGNKDTNGLFALEGGAASDVLGPTAKSFGAEISDVGSAATLTLRLHALMNSNDEDAAVDSFSLTSCDEAAPQTTAAADTTSTTSAPTTATATTTAAPTTGTTTTAAAVTTVATTVAAASSITQAPASSTATDPPQGLLFEDFETRAGMTLSPNFAASGQDIFGLFGGTASDFGSASTADALAYLGTVDYMLVTLS
jgi:hypothetical protein